MTRGLFIPTGMESVKEVASFLKDAPRARPLDSERLQDDLKQQLFESAVRARG